MHPRDQMSLGLPTCRGKRGVCVGGGLMYNLIHNTCMWNMLHRCCDIYNYGAIIFFSCVCVCVCGGGGHLLTLARYGNSCLPLTTLICSTWMISKWNLDKEEEGVAPTTLYPCWVFQLAVVQRVTTGGWLTWLEETDVGHTLPCLLVRLPHTCTVGLVLTRSLFDGAMPSRELSRRFSLQRQLVIRVCHLTK